MKETIKLSDTYDYSEDILPHFIPQNYFAQNIPSRDTYISKTHLIKPPGGPWTCAALLQDVKSFKLKHIEYHNIQLENYCTDILVANGMHCDILYIQKSTSHMWLKTKDCFINQTQMRNT